MVKRMLELFSGTGNMAAAFSAEGYRTLTVDLYEGADLQMDVRELTVEMILDHLGGYPDVVWASPPLYAVQHRERLTSLAKSKAAYPGNRTSRARVASHHAAAAASMVYREPSRDDAEASSHGASSEEDAHVLPVWGSCDETYRCLDECSALPSFTLQKRRFLPRERPERLKDRDARKEGCERARGNPTGLVLGGREAMIGPNRGKLLKWKPRKAHAVVADRVRDAAQTTLKATIPDDRVVHESEERKRIFEKNHAVALASAQRDIEAEEQRRTRGW